MHKPKNYYNSQTTQNHKGKHQRTYPASHTPTDIFPRLQQPTFYEKDNNRPSYPIPKRPIYTSCSHFGSWAPLARSFSIIPSLLASCIFTLLSLLLYVWTIGGLTVSSPLKDRGLGLGGIKIHNTALLAKWGQRYSKSESTLWRKIIRSIHGKEVFDWFTKEKSGNSLRSLGSMLLEFGGRLTHQPPLGNNLRIGFQSDPWVGNTPIKEQFSRLFRVALLPISSVAAHWDHDTSSWSLVFKRSLKDEEIAKFQSFRSLLSPEKVVNSDDFRSWSIDPSIVQKFCKRNPPINVSLLRSLLFA